MNAPLFPLRRLTLHPGDVACVDRGERLDTLLGSCVAILLTDPQRSVGAMCHVVHAGAPRDCRRATPPMATPLWPR